MREEPVETEDNFANKNIYGQPLAKCDRPGYFAVNPEARDHRFPHTGYTRNDFCGSMTEDGGSHYVCVEMPKAQTASGQVYSSFWTETGQAASGEVAVGWPKPGPWCICMWAFARMRSRHPHFKDMLTCSATNYWVVKNYNINDRSECEALHALCEQCDIVGQAARPDVEQKCRWAAQSCGGAGSVERLASSSAKSPTAGPIRSEL